MACPPLQEQAFFRCTILGRLTSRHGLVVSWNAGECGETSGAPAAQLDGQRVSCEEREVAWKKTVSAPIEPRRGLAVVEDTRETRASESKERSPQGSEAERALDGSPRGSSAGSAMVVDAAPESGVGDEMEAVTVPDGSSSRSGMTSAASPDKASSRVARAPLVTRVEQVAEGSPTAGAREGTDLEMSVEEAETVVEAYGIDMGTQNCSSRPRRKQPPAKVSDDEAAPATSTGLGEGVVSSVAKQRYKQGPSASGESALGVRLVHADEARDVIGRPPVPVDGPGSSGVCRDVGASDSASGIVAQETGDKGGEVVAGVRHVAPPLVRQEDLDLGREHVGLATGKLEDVEADPAGAPTETGEVVPTAGDRTPGDASRAEIQAAHSTPPAVEDLNVPPDVSRKGPPAFPVQSAPPLQPRAAIRESSASSRLSGRGSPSLARGIAASRNTAPQASQAATEGTRTPRRTDVEQPKPPLPSVGGSRPSPVGTMGVKRMGSKKHVSPALEAVTQAPPIKERDAKSRSKVGLESHKGAPGAEMGKSSGPRRKRSTSRLPPGPAAPLPISHGDNVTVARAESFEFPIIPPQTSRSSLLGSSHWDSAHEAHSIGWKEANEAGDAAVAPPLKGSVEVTYSGAKGSAVNTVDSPHGGRTPRFKSLRGHRHKEAETEDRGPTMPRESAPRGCCVLM